MQTTTRRQSKKQAVLEELLAARRGRTYTVDTPQGSVEVSDGWVPSTVLERRAGWRFVARLFDLKDEDSIDYESRRLIGSLWVYRATRFSFA